MGIAMALLQECEKQMKVRRIHLCVRKSNLPAIQLYSNDGYKQIDVWRAYYGDHEDAFVLEKLVDKHVDSVLNKGYTSSGD
jgi:ribosomal protein S18 acetylase RimI-like enzyme